MKKAMMYIILIIACVIAVFMVTAFFFQEKLIFFPQILPLEHEYEFSNTYEERWFETVENIKINALHFKAENSKGLVLYFHGNAGSLDSWGHVATNFLPLNYDVLIMDFRGYGKSSGNISNEKMLHHDAAFIYNAMKNEYREENIILYGRSFGTGIAAKLAAENHPKLLVLESPYYNFPDVAKTHYPFLPIESLIKYKLPNNTYLQKTDCPVHIIHGTKDGVIPYHSAERLAEINEKITLHTIQGGGHNNLSDYNEFHQLLRTIFL